MVTPASQLVNGYRNIRKLNEGTFGELFLVENVKTNERYTMKMLSNEDDEQFNMNELEFLKSTKHPFIIKYIEDFPFPSVFIDKHCIILEHANGSDLRNMMNSEEITEQVALNLTTQACLGLAQIHSRGIVHGGIKPDNILIVEKEIGGIVKLGDFGTIKQILSTSKQSFRVGTYQYFAPERRSIKYQGEVDVWALGIILYEMVSGGQFPFDYDFENGSLEDYLIQLPDLILKQLPDHISENCKILIKKMLEKDPLKRPNVFDIFSSAIIYERIKLITELQILGSDIAKIIKKQLVDLNLDGSAQVEEHKELPATCSQTSTSANSLASQQYTQSVHSIDKQLSNLSIQPLPASMKYASYTQSGLNAIIQKIRQRGHDKLVDVALQKGLLQLTILNSNQMKEVKVLEFEGNEFYQSGGTYYGECVEGLRDGWGMLYCIRKDGDQCFFDCEWSQGVPVQGKRMLICEDQWQFYEGQFDARLLRTGTGRNEHEDGKTYQGEYIDGQLNGHGKIKYANGASYEGEWKDGNFHGQGKYTWINGDTYQGEYRDHSKHGLGKYIYAYGATFEGEYRDGNKHGFGRSTQADGDYQEGQYQNGNPIEVHKCFSKQGKLINFRNYVGGQIVEEEKIQ
ncbi:hypothetical protein FGO68_gene5128 [Halteria grandinella]|uniref:Protein kinase domain-containing protein n=1 Tax=Halteria grandinella TaxID=5974 RepID=A0A8J8P4Y2_HALGN|nr:hypothetical protein FGO68_gene5128 [Halteria grandinella]